MAYYRICPGCGANLDPGEICDCVKEPDTTPPDRGQSRQRAEPGLRIRTRHKEVILRNEQYKIKLASGASPICQ